MRRWLFLVSHGVVFAAGFALGIYVLPILTAAPPPSAAQYQAAEGAQTMRATFRRDLPGSDLFHWGEGEVMVSPTHIAHKGSLAPGPDYRLYLVPDYVEDGAAFMAIKAKAVQIADVRGFSGFVVSVPPGVDVQQFTTVLIWCERFKAFITAAKYR